MFDGERLFKVLSTVTTKEIEAARQDKTVIAEIVEIENVDSGKYKVEYQGNTFSALSTNLDIVYKEGEQVYVLVPQGDFSSQKLILGYSSYKGKEEESNLTNFYVDGSELVGNTGLYTLLQSELGICAGKINGEVPDEEYGFNLNSLSSIPQEILKIMDSVQTMSKTYDYIKISGDFKTNFVETHEIGEYSLKIGLLCLKQDTDEAEEDYIINELSLGFSTFTGAPYSYIEYTPQTTYFAIPKGSVCGLAYIKLTQQGFVQEHIPKTETLFTNDNIFVRNIEISFAQKINLADTLWYAYLTTPKGTQVNSQNPNIKLMPHLLYKGHDVFNTDNCEVYWFRQKADVTIADVEEQDKDEHNKTWFDYGGNGWYPISKFIDDKGLVETAEEESVVETDINVDNLTYHYSIENDGSLIINQAAVPFKWQYKAVIVYRDTSTNKYSTQEFPLEPITIVNTESEYDLEIEKYINGLFSTYLRIRNHKKDPYGVQMALDGRPYREWFGTYWLERIDGSYEMVSEEYFLGAYNINRFLSAPIARFYIQCYDPYIIDPQNKAVLLNDTNSPYTAADIKASLLKDVGEVADLVFECVNIDDSELNVSWGGRDSFHYDTTGQLKSWVAERDNVIKPMLKWTTNSVSSYSLVVYGPGGAELTRRDISDNNYFEQNSYENTYDCDDSMMLGMYIDQDKCIHFKVREQFDESKTDNTFKLEISLSGRSEPFEIYKTITFVKDGDQGTMGSEWAAPIYPCNYAASTSNQAKFTARLDSQQTTPLVVVFNPNDSTAEWIQWDGSRIVLRPFITKNGIRIEEMDPYEGYFYRCYWDVRTPNSINNALAKNASFLRLYRVASGETTTAEGYNTRVFSGFWSEGTQHNQNENHPDGLVAKTGYPVSLEDSGQDSAWPENYGAVEVRFFDNRCPDFTGSTLNQNENNTIKYKGTGATLEDMQYRFVVKCQIDIFKGQYNKATNMIHENGDNVKVASITSFYPVDMIFTTSAELSREGSIVSSLSKKMQTNWPCFIQYNSSGYDPVTNIDKEGLYLVIGDEDKSKLTNYLGENLTPLIQEIENRADEKGNITQVYKPSTHLNMTEGFCGAIRTTPGAAFFDDEQSFFVRNQVMYLNSFANVDINGWDGQSIETDEDNGSIFAATFGAGFKEPTTNLFTGVVMGMDKSQRRDQIKGETHDADYIRSHPYMTGIFGFQDGVSSFGLMENGTGFFGRPDRGGRIIFDGSNATMYGGANGTMESPSIGDPMWNTMRLSFVDLTHPTSSISVKGADGQLIEQGFDGEYFKDSKLSNRTNDTNMPRWYRKMWERAYIKPNGELPYWYSKNGETTKWEDLLWYTQSDTSNYSNRRIDYYTGENNVGGASSIFTGVDEEKIAAQRAALKYAKEQYDIDPKGYYDASQVLTHLEGVINSYKGISKSKVYLDLLDIVSQSNNLSGFGAARSSTTPAIEVGQHIDGLMPGIFDWDDYESIFKELRIPGNRNFMVTYDGTMWAMNGVFMGAIIGSNIVGGRIQGAEIGIGTKNTNLDIYTVSSESLALASYSSLMSPEEESLLTSRSLLELKGGGRNLGFYVSSSGEVVANNISIYGGKIDVGHFHILGSEQTDYKERGHLVQNATSDFIGETHCYGGLTVSPSESVTNNYRSNYGNFFQTHGTVALGISKDKHAKIVDRYWNTDYTGGYSGNGGAGLNGDNFNQCCFFGLDTANDAKTDYRGHFWPLSFKLSENNGNLLSYVTMMDIFEKESNYFRIGPWGTEGVKHFVRTDFQSENWCEEPTEGNSLGYIGNIGGNIGIFGWSGKTIALTVGGSSTILITKDNIVFSSHGKTYDLDALAATGAQPSSEGVTIMREDEEETSAPTYSSRISSIYGNVRPPRNSSPATNSSTPDSSGGIWKQEGSYSYYWAYSASDNQYHKTTTYRYVG